MRTLLIYIILIFLLISCSVNSDSNRVKSHNDKSCNLLITDTIQKVCSNESVKITSMLDLFYGMSTNPSGYYCDSLLDTIPGLIHKEFSSMWYHTGDSIRFRMTMGLYIDECYPSDILREKIIRY